MKIRILFTFLLLNLFLFVQAAQQVRTVSSVTESMTLDSAVEFHITSNSNCISSGATINLTDESAWVVFDNVKPSSVIKNYLGNITNNGEALEVGVNCFVNIYKTGTAILPHGSKYTPLTVYTGKNYEGNSRTFIPGKYTSLSTFNNSIKSLKIKRGYMVTVAQSNTGAGYSRVFMAHDSDIEISDLMDENQCKNGFALYNKISFIRVSRLQMPSKKGVVYSGMADSLNCSWDYNYDCGTGSGSPDQEFVPMFHHVGWNSWAGTGTQSDVTGITHALGFNEPWNTADEGYMGDDPYAPMRYQPEAYLTGRRVGTPAPTDGNLGKLYTFVDSCDRAGHRIDYVVIHYYRGGKAYDGNASAFISDMKSVYDRLKRPIWITEFNNGANWTDEYWPEDPAQQQAKQDKELTAMVKALEDMPYVERYAIYNAVEWKRYVYDNGSLTPAGRSYRNINSKFAYNSAYEYIPTLPQNFTKTEFGMTTNSLTQTVGRLTLTVKEVNEGHLDSCVVTKQVGSAAPTTLRTITTASSSTTSIVDLVNVNSKELVTYVCKSYYNNDATPRYVTTKRYNPASASENKEGNYTSSIQNNNFEYTDNELIKQTTLGVYGPESWNVSFTGNSLRSYALIANSTDTLKASNGNQFYKGLLYGMSSIDMSQITTSFSSGVYEIAFDAIIPEANTSDVEVYITSSDSKTSYVLSDSDDWKQHRVPFIVESAQELTIGFSVKQSRSIGSTEFCLDNIIIRRAGALPPVTGTDYTSLIPNASFDGNATLKTSTSNGGVYQPEDWTVAYPTTETWDQSRVVTSLDAVNPANGTKFIYTRLRWATNSYNLSTTTTEELPAGYYALSFSYISPTAATYPVTATVKTGNVSKVVTLAKTSATTWTTKNILFQIEEGEKATINVHLDHKDGNDEGILYLDNFGLKRVTDYMNEIEDIVVEEDNNLIIQDGFVVTKDNTPITIFDLSGRIISSNNRLQPGIYVIKYSDKTKKIIIE